MYNEKKILFICIFHLWNKELLGTMSEFVNQQYNSLLVNFISYLSHHTFFS